MSDNNPLQLYSERFERLKERYDRGERGTPIKQDTAALLADIRQMVPRSDEAGKTLERHVEDLHRSFDDYVCVMRWNRDGSFTAVCHLI